MKLLPHSSLFKQPYFGISLHKDSIRAVSIASDKTMNAASQVVISPDVYDHGIIKMPEFISAMKTLISQADFHTNFAAITIPDIYSFSRLHTIPKIELSEISEAIGWQIEQIFPLPKSEIYFDWKLINQTESSLTVLVVALRKALLDDLVSVSDAVGIKPISFEPASSALARVVKSPQDNISLVIEINQLGIATTLIENQLSILTITHELNLQQDTNLLVQKVNQSIAEIKNFYISKNKTLNNPPTIYLTGESINDQITNWLSQSINLPLQVLPLPQVPPSHHQAYAAAATQVYPPESELSINLLPTKLQQLFDASLKKRQIITTLQICFGLLFLSLTLACVGFFFCLIKIQAANQTILSLENKPINYQFDTKQLAALNKSSGVIVRLFNLKTTPVDFIETIYSLLPPDFVIDNYIYSKEKNSLVLIGTAPTRPKLMDFKDQLKKTKKFADVRLPLESLEKQTNVNFSMSLILPTTTGKKK